MNDKNLGMILATATAIAAPVVVVCCGGGLALPGSALAGMAGLFSGMDGGLSGVLAIFGLRRPKEVRGWSDPVRVSKS